jgi:16S rRNA (cytidine1402-2'-O)-methyltransferase
VSPGRLPHGAAEAGRPAGTLFVVATPIGNLEDITLRALRVLREVDVVAAEDTRRTGNLLRYYQISKPLVSLHEHNERERAGEILERLRAGQSVALVSDAGTPGISDPGSLLVRVVRAEQLPIVPVPGPSTLAAALSVSGVDGPVTFAGFVPSRANDRIQWLQDLARLENHAIVCFEAPHRLRQTLAAISSILGNRQILAGREVTKVHEEWKLGTAEELLSAFPEPKGEFVLVIFPKETVESEDGRPSDDTIAAEFWRLTKNGSLTRREAVKKVAEQLHLSPRDVYAAIERTKR